MNTHSLLIAVAVVAVILLFFLVMAGVLIPYLISKQSLKNFRNNLEIGRFVYLDEDGEIKRCKIINRNYGEVFLEHGKGVLVRDKSKCFPKYYFHDEESEIKTTGVPSMEKPPPPPDPKTISGAIAIHDKIESMQESLASGKDIFATIETVDIMTLDDLPDGSLFMHGITLGLKLNHNTIQGAIEAFIVGSGEMFWGGKSTPEEQKKVMVRQIKLNY